MVETIQTLFRSGNRKQYKFLSRVFGIFGEEIVRCWARDDNSPYKDLGRPTIKLQKEAKVFTLDFVFESKDSGKAYVGEMKCELEYQNYKYLTLCSPEQLFHHSKPAFQKFLELANDPGRFNVTVGGNSVSVYGSILVWGRCTEQGRVSVMDRYGLNDVLSMENIIQDLVKWENKEFVSLLADYESWISRLFSGLRQIK